MINKTQLIKMAEKLVETDSDGLTGRELVGLKKLLNTTYVANYVIDSGDAEYFVESSEDFDGLKRLAEDISYNRDEDMTY